MEKKKIDLIGKFRASAKTLSNPASLAVCAMLLAITLVLSYFGNISISLFGSGLIKISFTLIPVAIAAMLYGPIPAGIIGALSDVIGFMIAPMGAYIPGFTISMLLIGFTYGIVLFEENMSVGRIAISQLIVSVFLSWLLGSLWFVLFYGFQPLHALSVRGIKELVTYPINVFAIFVLAQGVCRIPEIKKLRGERS